MRVLANLLAMPVVSAWVIWLAADGDGRNAKDASLREGVRCHDTGCVAKLGDGRLVVMALGVEAFEDDCVRAAVVLSPRSAPGECSALLIDRNVWRSRGAIALRAKTEGFADGGGAARG